MTDKEKDLENGGADKQRERISFADGWYDVSPLLHCLNSHLRRDPDKDEGEYANLIRYISTYRDRRFSKAPSQVSGEDVADATKKKSRPWYKRWFTHGGTQDDLFPVPEEWLDTTLKGLSAEEVENRRRKTGYNELTTEKENMFLKFLGYFKGPILYGKYSRLAIFSFF